MWLKKKSVLQIEGHYNTEFSADGSTDLRTTRKDYSNTNSSIHLSGLPDAADAGNYFYLPALGFCGGGELNEVGSYGRYWSSSSLPGYSLYAYYLRFSPGSVSVENNLRNSGYRVGVFE